MTLHRAVEAAAVIVAVAFGAMVLLILLLLASISGRAHDSWISQSKFRDPVSGDWCCGELDCAAIAPGGVRVVPGGYMIVETGEVIPESRMQPSPDGDFWRCQYLDWPRKGKTRCFFGGLPGN